MRPTEKTPGPRRVIARTRPAPSVLAILLFLLVFALYSPSLRYELVAIDDIHYISHNQLVLSGLPGEHRAAFTDFHSANGRAAPVDFVYAGCQLSRRESRAALGFHCTNVLLHSLTP